MKLSDLKTGEHGVIVKVQGHGGFRKRIIEMGFIRGKEVEVLLNAPLQDPGFAWELRASGALLQVNAGSVLGREGLRQKQLVKKLLQKELVDVIASDAHDVRIRTPELELCARQIEKKYGRSLAQRLLCDSPKAILMGSKE